MTGETPQREYVNAKEAAEVLGVNERTVRRWVQARRLRAANLGVRVIRIARADLDAYVAAHVVVAPTAVLREVVVEPTQPGPEDAQ